MALIKCKECGKEISDKAKMCVNCGCPVVLDTQKQTQQTTQNIQKQTAQQKQSKTTMGVASMVLGILAILSILAYVVTEDAFIAIVFSVISLPLRHIST